MLKLGMLASHRGSTVERLVQACRDGRVRGEPRVVISNNSGARVLEVAKAAQIPAFCIGGAAYASEELRDRAILETLQRHGVELVLLLGYMRKLGPETLRAYRGRVLNTHPALLPKFGGQGMFGMHVHRAVVAAGETESGATLHVVDEWYDHGPVLLQRRVPVLTGDDPEALQQRVQGIEHELLVEGLNSIESGQLVLPAP
ncbi:MAG TPA: phosphoribosylglycinamide formyltransferase [Polyangiaceae bacterium]|nr:phosphoribosylglycinamide formyltransferase [Polyangiaceae bacterium]